MISQLKEDVKASYQSIKKVITPKDKKDSIQFLDMIKKQDPANYSTALLRDNLDRLLIMRKNHIGIDRVNSIYEKAEELYNVLFNTKDIDVEEFNNVDNLIASWCMVHAHMVALLMQEEYTQIEYKNKPSISLNVDSYHKEFMYKAERYDKVPVNNRFKYTMIVFILVTILKIISVVNGPKWGGWRKFFFFSFLLSIIYLLISSILVHAKLADMFSKSKK